MSDPTELTLSETAAAVAGGELSPVEVTDAYLARIEKLNPELTAFVTVTAERARADAQALADDVRHGRLRGPLHGVPIGLKDLIDTAGIVTAAGTAAYKGRVPERDATVARSLHEAGSVLLGKLATHELAYGVTTANPKSYGVTVNPWDYQRIPGGSSGGSGAAIAARLAAGTIGTDTGGSIRIPASFCGCVGFKPTYGVVSRAGIAPLSWFLDHAGPITATVRDAALILDVIGGYDPDDEATLPGAGGVAGVADGLDGDVTGLRVGYRGPRRGPHWKTASARLRRRPWRNSKHWACAWTRSSCRAIGTSSNRPSQSCRPSPAPRTRRSGPIAATTSGPTSSSSCRFPPSTATRRSRCSAPSPHSVKRCAGFSVTSTCWSRRPRRSWHLPTGPRPSNSAEPRCR